MNGQAAHTAAMTSAGSDRGPVNQNGPPEPRGRAARGWAGEPAAVMKTSRHRMALTNVGMTYGSSISARKTARPRTGPLRSSAAPTPIGVIAIVVTSEKTTLAFTELSSELEKAPDGDSPST